MNIDPVVNFNSNNNSKNNNLINSNFMMSKTQNMNFYKINQNSNTDIYNFDINLQKKKNINNNIAKEQQENIEESYKMGINNNNKINLNSNLQIIDENVNICRQNKFKQSEDDDNYYTSPKIKKDKEVNIQNVQNYNIINKKLPNKLIIKEKFQDTKFGSLFSNINSLLPQIQINSNRNTDINNIELKNGKNKFY